MGELWELYDKDKNKINKIVKRGDKLNDDEFHIVVNVWIKNKNNEFLITQRSINKSFPLIWETTGGSALLGEDSIDAAIREVKEELNISLKKEDAKLIGTTLRYFENCPDILYVYLFESNCDISEIKIQEEEVNDVMWATKDEIIDLYKIKKFEANAFFYDAINK